MATQEIKTAPAKKAAPAKKKQGFQGIESAIWIIIACIVIAALVYKFIYGNPNHFVGGNPDGEVLDGNLLGTVYKGGVIVPLIQGLFLTVLAISIERWFALRTAFGKGSIQKFVENVKEALKKGDLETCNKLCDKQRGSVANVVGATLKKYKECEEDHKMKKEQKIISIRQELEEATALEMPTLQMNLPIIAAISSLGTLFGLLGTVTGMIKSFAALASGGGADSVALSTGISEALVNTACGIATGALAIITYNYFTNKIDHLTFALDEIGFSIVNTYAATHIEEA